MYMGLKLRKQKKKEVEKENIKHPRTHSFSGANILVFEPSLVNTPPSCQI